MITAINPYSYASPDFLWIGEYTDGTHLPEYDRETLEKNDFYALDRNRLVRFGLIGHGMCLYYEAMGGFFKLNGEFYEIIYQVGEKEYYLTGQSQHYNDAITFKDAESFMLREGEPMPVHVLSYNFGYKTQLQIDGVEFRFKAICSVPFDEPVNFRLTLTADKNLKGKLLIKKNGEIVSEIESPLTKKKGGHLKWAVR